MSGNEWFAPERTYVVKGLVRDTLLDAHSDGHAVPVERPTTEARGVKRALATPQRRGLLRPLLQSLRVASHLPVGREATPP